MTQRSYADTLSFTFDEATNLADLIANGSITSAVTITNLGINADADPDTPLSTTANQFRYEFDEETGSSRLTWSLDEFTAGRQSLENGVYQVVIRSNDVADAAGNPLDGNGDDDGVADYSFLFHRLLGDADGSGVVDDDDMSVILESLGRNSSMDTWDANPDLDRDGRISVRDRIAVARSNGRQVTYPVIEPVAPAITASASAEYSPFDTNQDGNVSALDALMVINHLGRRTIVAESDSLTNIESLIPRGYDVNGDGIVSALDALQIINQLNRQSNSSRLASSPSPESTAQLASVAADPVFDSTPDDKDDDLLDVLADDQLRLMQDTTI